MSPEIYCVTKYEIPGPQPGGIRWHENMYQKNERKAHSRSRVRRERKKGGDNVSLSRSQFQDVEDMFLCPDDLVPPGDDPNREAFLHTADIAFKT
ncbi:unnamed protein product [Darwinula stevensoni]|uniref:Uncharacterized protein n=1 Tax=Darwinula stevensoni TaxID=69355 RepID=A0A7R8XIE9_9CRUS|nr:unnamed protein product [Darwinula stevensoni]CAG0893381.1 unnamed protein product [Darwinula stevensoni]